jgi:hypothetical protein
MSINYEDIKSEWLVTPQNGEVSFTILADAMKVTRISKRTGNPYPAYEFKVEDEHGNICKFSALRGSYRQMVNDAGKPETLVGCRFKSSHSRSDGVDEYAVIFISAPEKGGSK